MFLFCLLVGWCRALVSLLSLLMSCMDFSSLRTHSEPEHADPPLVALHDVRVGGTDETLPLIDAAKPLVADLSFYRALFEHHATSRLVVQFACAVSYCNARASLAVCFWPRLSFPVIVFFRPPSLFSVARAHLFPVFRLSTNQEVAGGEKGNCDRLIESCTPGCCLVHLLLPPASFCDQVPHHLFLFQLGCRCNRWCTR